MPVLSSPCARRRATSFVAWLVPLLLTLFDARAEIQVVQDDTLELSAWLSDNVDRLYYAGPVYISRYPCGVTDAATGSPAWWPIAYRTYPAGSFAGCAHTGDDALIEVLDRMDAHLRWTAAFSQNDQFPLRFSTLVVLGPGELVKVYGQYKTAPASVARNRPDDGPPRACGSTARAMAGDPILVATGQNIQVVTDYRSPGADGLLFQRFYDSEDVGSDALGVGWRHTFLRRIEQLEPVDGVRRIHVIRASGRLMRFTSVGDGWSADAADHASLESFHGGWRFHSEAGDLEDYDAKGRLLSITTASGHAVQVRRDALGRIASVADSFGRSLGFTHDAGGRLVELRDPSGGVVHYDYAATNGIPVLSRVTDAGGGSTTYLHESSRFGAALTGQLDEKGARHASWSYDNQGRAVMSERAGGVDRTEFAYGASSTSVTDALGATRSLDFQMLDGVAFLGAALQPAGSGSVAAARRWLHDAAGNLVVKDDFNQTRTCLVHDGRHQPVGQVEGLDAGQDCTAVLPEGAVLPAGARKSSWRWHPDGWLETGRAEPGRFLSWAYNGQPDPLGGQSPVSCTPADALLPDGRPIAVPCKRLVQASEDGDGHLGFGAVLQALPAHDLRWTYNALGQVLSATEQGGEGERKTTYAYHLDNTATHTRGDLASITGPMGEVVRFTGYDKHGLVLQSMAPDGSVTINSYDAMQRLLRTSLNGEGVSISYDAVGQVIRITDDDGVWVGYAYDDAHRRTAVFDDQGRRIDFELDAAGHVVGRTVRDPDGALARSHRRAMDSLGRMQQRAERG